MGIPQRVSLIQDWYKTSGRPRNALDMIIAAIAEANGCIVVSDNERDFAGVPVVNPLRPNPRKSD